MSVARLTYTPRICLAHSAADKDEYADRRDELKRLVLEFEDATPAQFPKYVGESEEPEK